MRRSVAWIRSRILQSSPLFSISHPSCTAFSPLHILQSTNHTASTCLSLPLREADQTQALQPPHRSGLGPKARCSAKAWCQITGRLGSGSNAVVFIPLTHWTFKLPRTRKLILVMGQPGSCRWLPRYMLFVPRPSVLKRCFREYWHGKGSSAFHTFHKRKEFLSSHKASANSLPHASARGAMHMLKNDVPRLATFNLRATKNRLLWRSLGYP